MRLLSGARIHVNTVIDAVTNLGKKHQLIPEVKMIPQPTINPPPHSISLGIIVQALGMEQPQESSITHPLRTILHDALIQVSLLPL